MKITSFCCKCYYKDPQKYIEDKIEILQKLHEPFRNQWIFLKKILYSNL
ncbi:hypothetical protein LEP1GSC166_3095 [Leptospira kirschneri]|nr:hypothetical protein LEP1GSC166_3095 [Leptospira kirschneri]